MVSHWPRRFSGTVVVCGGGGCCCCVDGASGDPPPPQLQMKNIKGSSQARVAHWPGAARLEYVCMRNPLVQLVCATATDSRVAGERAGGAECPRSATATGWRAMGLALPPPRSGGGRMAWCYAKWVFLFG